MNYECNVCDKSFKQKKALSDHKRTHNKKEFEDKNLNCDDCEFKTHRTFNLKKHRKVHEKAPSDPIAILTCSELYKF